MPTSGVRSKGGAGVGCGLPCLPNASARPINRRQLRCQIRHRPRAIGACGPCAQYPIPSGPRPSGMSSTSWKSRSHQLTESTVQRDHSRPTMQGAAAATITTLRSVPDRGVAARRPERCTAGSGHAPGIQTASAARDRNRRAAPEHLSGIAVLLVTGGARDCLPRMKRRIRDDGRTA